MKKTLCVGINKYTLPGNNLEGCANDARNMAAFLQKFLGIAPEDIILLLDEQAAKAAIWAKLTALVEEARAGKLTYLAYTHSSHGTQFQGPDRVHEALCCHDTAARGEGWDPATIITDHEIHHLVETLPLNVRLELWFDTCHAGGVREFGARAKFLTPPAELPPAVHALWPRLFSTGYGQAVIWAACGPNQTSADAYLSGQACGAFTHFWLTNYQAGLNRSRLISLSKAGLARDGFSQVPLLECAWELALKKVGE